MARSNLSGLSSLDTCEQEGDRKLINDLYYSRSRGESLQSIQGNYEVIMGIKKIPEPKIIQPLYLHCQIML
jgi:hypothetical protein